jgi:hypothetical protein
MMAVGLSEGRAIEAFMYTGAGKLNFFSRFFRVFKYLVERKADKRNIN